MGVTVGIGVTVVFLAWTPAKVLFVNTVDFPKNVQVEFVYFASCPNN
jgi:hypothetical protein